MKILFKLRREVVETHRASWAVAPHHRRRRLRQRNGSRRCRERGSVVSHSSFFTYLNLPSLLQLEQRVAKLAKKTHKDRVADFNKHLESLSEHHDIPKVRTVAGSSFYSRLLTLSSSHRSVRAKISLRFFLDLLYFTHLYCYNEDRYIALLSFVRAKRVLQSVSGEIRGFSMIKACLNW